MSRNFPGSGSNYLDIGDIASIDITGTALTVAAWISPDASVQQSIICKANTPSQTTRQYWLFIDTPGNLEFHIGDSGGRDFIAGTSSFTTGVWAHVVGRKNGTGAGALAIFKNGIAESVGTGSTTSNRSIQNRADSLRIGSDSQAAANLFNGRIAHVAIWNVALSDGEIKSLANGVNPRLIRPGNLKGYWPLWGTGTLEPDMALGAAPATIVGSVPAGSSAPQLVEEIALSDITTPDVPISIVTDSDTVSLRLTPSATDVEAGLDSATVPLLFTPFFYVEYDDSDTVRLSLSVQGGECFSTALITPEGEASKRWSGSFGIRLDGDAEPRFNVEVTVQDTKC